MTATPAHTAQVVSPASVATQPPAHAAPARSRGGAFLATTKPGITRLVTMTATVGFIACAVARPWELWPLLVALAGCIVGTALSAAGANALNQWMEHHRDALMPRTRHRPIPAGQTHAGHVLWFGTALCVAGLAVLWVLCGWPAMALSLACIISYLAMYTPLKVRTPLSTFVGAIPGALPPMIGAAAASTHAGWQAIIEPAGLSLFILMFIWQIPHFMAIAWMYKDDYAQGGYLMLPAIDPDGAATSWTMVLWALALLPASLLPGYTLGEQSFGPVYMALATLTGVGFLALCVRLLLDRTRAKARVVFFASIIHLPVLLLAMVVESLARVI